jgi:hypothetical protein
MACKPIAPSQVIAFDEENTTWHISDAALEFVVGSRKEGFKRASCASASDKDQKSSPLGFRTLNGANTNKPICAESTSAFALANGQRSAAI